MAFPREGARDMGNGHLAPCRVSPSAISNSVLFPQYWGPAGASLSLSPPSRLGTVWGDKGTRAAWLGY